MEFSQAYGTVGGNLVNNGTVSPGDSPGTLTVNGNYTQNASGNLIIEIAEPRDARSSADGRVAPISMAR